MSSSFSNRGATKQLLFSSINYIMMYSVSRLTETRTDVNVAAAGRGSAAEKIIVRLCWNCNYYRCTFELTPERLYSLICIVC